MFRFLIAALALAASSGCAYSFGSDVQAEGSRRRPVHHTSFGGDIEVPNAPRGVRLRSFGGDLRMGSLEGASKASSYGGDIVIESLQGSARLASYGGEVDVQIDNAPAGPNRLVAINSFGGDVVVRVPADFSARMDITVLARHSRADVDSDFELSTSRTRSHPLTRLGRAYDEVHAVGTIGGGRHLIRIRAEDANVRLERLERS